MRLLGVAGSSGRNSRRHQFDARPETATAASANGGLGAWFQMPRFICAALRSAVRSRQPTQDNRWQPAASEATPTPAHQLINNLTSCQRSATRVEAADSTVRGYRLSHGKFRKVSHHTSHKLLRSFTRELYCVMSGIELRYLYGFTLPPTLCLDRCDAPRRRGGEEVAEAVGGVERGGSDPRS